MLYPAVCAVYCLVRQIMLYSAVCASMGTEGGVHNWLGIHLKQAGTVLEWGAPRH